MMPLDFPNDKRAGYSFSSLKNMADVYVEEVSYPTKRKKELTRIKLAQFLRQINSCKTE